MELVVNRLLAGNGFGTSGVLPFDSEGAPLGSSGFGEASAGDFACGRDGLIGRSLSEEITSANDPARVGETGRRYA